MKTWVLPVLLLLAACRSRATSTGAEAPPPAGDAGAALERVGEVTAFQVAFGRLGRGVVLRTFRQGSRSWGLVLDPSRLTTEVVPVPSPVAPVDLEAFEASPWTIGRAEALRRGSSLQDSGLTHVFPSEAGLVLTIDLCPSRKHFDVKLLQRVLDVFGPEERPVPVAIAVSGVWLEEHPDDLAAIRDYEQRGLTITWINHSMHHRYVPGAPLRRNFLLEPGTNVRSEVLDAEVVMLTRGLTPSVFFRFPGLISEPAIVREVAALGLIPIGSDAWLAKGQPAHQGSIVLVHGNGNEPRGIEDFFKLLEAERKAITRRQFLLLDLREALAEGAPR